MEKFYVKDDFEKALHKLLFGGRYDFGRKNDICYRENFRRYGFDNVILVQFITDFKRELNIPSDFVLLSDTNMKLSHFINANILAVNNQIFQIKK
jgi:hypothetical protein